CIIFWAGSCSAPLPAGWRASSWASRAAAAWSISRWAWSARWPAAFCSRRWVAAQLRAARLLDFAAGGGGWRYRRAGGLERHHRPQAAALVVTVLRIPITLRRRRHAGDLATLLPAVDGGHRHLVSLVDATGHGTQRHERVAVDVNAGGGDPRGAVVTAK